MARKGVRAGWRKLGPRAWVKTSSQKRRAYRGSRARVAMVVPGYTRRAGFYRAPGRAGAGAELKFHDVDLNDAAISQAGTITNSINLIAQGVTESERIGRKCTLKKIGWKFDIQLLAATTPTANEVVRVIMYVDKQTNGAAATALNLLQTDDFQSFNNLENKGRFRTLMDRTYAFNPSISGDGTTIDTSTLTICDSFYKNVNLPIEFSGATGAITEVRSNNVGVLILSKVGGVSVFSSKIRLRFEG